MESMSKKKIPTYDPQTGELNPYYEELTGKKNPMTIKPIKKLVDDYKS
jgi:hypothetical protein